MPYNWWNGSWNCGTQFIYTMKYYSAPRNNDMGLKVNGCSWRKSS
jgi:hypothetical protein